MKYSAKSFETIRVYRNNKTGEVRVLLVFKNLRPSAAYVTKFFRPAEDLEIFSIKFLVGDWEATAAHWNTKDVLSIPESKAYVALALERLNSFVAALL